tara:strand:+ start:2073 stop:2825 length:753 start_codon:yes stop_codon:yes gene_type:complete
MGEIVYRLIWFQHIHKAAGTMVVNLAEANGEVLYPNNANGNPLDENGEKVELWKHSDTELGLFIDECEKMGVTFVATEHGSPDFNTLYEDERVVTITTLREPVSRAVSNYNHAYYAGYTQSRNLTEYLAEGRLFMSDNYYVRCFSRNEQLPLVKLSEEDLQTALGVLSKFDLVIQLGRDDVQGILGDELGWDECSVDTHPTFGNGWNLWNMIKKCKLGKAIRYLKKSDAPGDYSQLEGRYDLDAKLMEAI